MRVLLVHSDGRPFEVERYRVAWERAGGAAAELMPVAPATAARTLLDAGGRVDGLLLTGGPDVDPARYGEFPEPGVELHLDPARDALDAQLLACADRERWPVLGVCYGCQALNVFFGGTLIQDLDRAGFAGHRLGEPKNAIAHHVRLVGGDHAFSGLPWEFGVNSRHHQAIARVAERLRPIAHAPDGVIEAVEHATPDRLVLGVQWHPENFAAEPHPEIFRRFRGACLVRR